MQFPDELRKCVVFVGYRLPTGDISLQGTAFVVLRAIEGADRSFAYFVTARHLISGIKSKASDGKVFLRVNFKDGEAHSLETDVSHWFFHPDESEVDVAVCPFTSFSKDVDVLGINTGMFCDDERIIKFGIGIGDEICLAGLFYNHHGRARNIPIVRIGNIAAMPEERVLTKMGFIDAYLVEARSISGVSGSPVFAHLGASRIVEKQLRHVDKPAEAYLLLGLMHGHYDIEFPSEDSITEDARNIEMVNMGISIVVPAQKILEVLNQPMIRETEKKAEEKMREARLPTMDSISEKAKG